jgi:hypothetical protein
MVKPIQKTKMIDDNTVAVDLRVHEGLIHQSNKLKALEKENLDGFHAVVDKVSPCSVASVREIYKRCSEVPECISSLTTEIDELRDVIDSLMEE